MHGYTVGVGYTTLQHIFRTIFEYSALLVLCSRKDVSRRDAFSRIAERAMLVL